jgi:hypothetical protein
MPRSDIPCAATLLKELLDHAQRNPEAMGDRGTSALVIIIGTKDPLPQIHR